MENEKLIDQVNRIRKLSNGITKLAESLELLRVYAGERSNFYMGLKQIPPLSATTNRVDSQINSILLAFTNHLKNGLFSKISEQRKTQIDVVSDLLAQANDLLEAKNVHPAAPCMLIGASLEEFLRNWVEEQNLLTSNSKTTIDTYCKLLREKEIIDKQDVKDITSWAGLRNSAAHGEWDQVADKNRIRLMLEGVNLFMRKYS